MRIRKRIDSAYSDPEIIKDEDKEAEPPATPPPAPVIPYSGSSSSSETPTTVTPADCSSICTPVTAINYADLFHVPPEYGLVAPRADQRVHAPPHGFAAIYTLHFRYGLRLPLPPFVVAVLENYKIVLAQLHPNGIFTLLGFMRKCKGLSIVPTVGLFHHFFLLQRNGKHTEGWFSFQGRRGKMIISGHPKPVMGWKKKFLFFRTAPENLSLSWNRAPNKGLSEHEMAEKPCAQAISILLASAKEPAAEHEGLTGLADPLPDKGIAKGTTKTQIADKSSIKNEPSSIPIAMARNTTEHPKTAEIRQKKLKRIAEFYAIKPDKDDRFSE